MNEMLPTVRIKSYGRYLRGAQPITEAEFQIRRDEPIKGPGATTPDAFIETSPSKSLQFED
jgi:hypothetical protein